MKKNIGLLLFLFVGITVICGLIYGAAHQILRQSANDPQIQMAEEESAKLAGGGSLEDVNIGPDQIDIAQSLSPFTIVLSPNGAIWASNAFLNGKFAEIPPDVLERAKQAGQHRLTWQPQDEIRVALVVDYIDTDTGGFVAVGRNLREVEKRGQLIFYGIILAWGLLLLTTLVGIWFFSIDRFKSRSL